MNKAIALIGFILLNSLSIQKVYAHKATGLEISHAYVREVPPVSPTSAGFMTIKNLTNKAIKIVSAESQVAEKTELHNHINDNGVMRMREVPFIKIPANGQIKLKPAGLHIMLIGLKQPIKAYQNIDITLRLENGDETLVSMPVKSMKKCHKQGNHHTDHGHGNKHHHHH